jgi:hypothetical protein
VPAYGVSGQRGSFSRYPLSASLWGSKTRGRMGPMPGLAPFLPPSTRLPRRPALCVAFALPAALTVATIPVVNHIGP